jgi:hypothetical protein
MVSFVTVTGPSICVWPGVKSSKAIRGIGLVLSHEFGGSALRSGWPFRG